MRPDDDPRWWHDPGDGPDRGADRWVVGQVDSEHDPLQRTGLALRRARDARPPTVVGRIGRWFVIALPPLAIAGLLLWFTLDLVVRLL